MSLVVQSDEILSLLSSGRVFWGGHQQPLPDMTADDRIFSADADFRMGPDHHGRYDLVYLVEHDLGLIKQWPLILDEALRLIDKTGIVVLRLRESNLVTIFEAANQLFAACDGAVEPVFHDTAGGYHVLAARVVRREECASLESFGFGVITDGKRPDPVNLFVDSVMAMEGFDPAHHEILVCGPDQALDNLGARAGSVTFIRQPDHMADQGWITRKKNLIAQATRAETLLIAHDRYRMPTDFLAQMAAFGGDFSALVCRQMLPDGERFPDWVTTSSFWKWNQPALLDYGDYSPQIYINGGLMVVKTAVMRRHLLNELLLWSQGEDVEWTRRLQAAGIVPRLARNVAIPTINTRAGYKADFETAPAYDRLYVATGRAATDRLQPIPRYQVNSILDFGHENSVAALTERGAIPAAHWTLDHGCLLLQGRDGELCIQLDRTPDEGLWLRTDLADAAMRQHLAMITCNGALCVLNPIDPDAPHRVVGFVPRAAFTDRGVLRIRFSLLRDGALRLRRFQIGDSAQGETYDLGRLIAFGETGSACGLLRSGWAESDKTGVWTTAPVATLALPMNTPLPLNAALEITGRLKLPPDNPEGHVAVTINNMPVASWTVAALRPGQDVQDIACAAQLPRSLAGLSDVRMALHVGAGHPGDTALHLETLCLGDAE